MPSNPPSSGSSRRTLPQGVRSSPTTGSAPGSRRRSIRRACTSWGARARAEWRSAPADRPELACLEALERRGDTLGERGVLALEAQCLRRPVVAVTAVAAADPAIVLLLEEVYEPVHRPVGDTHRHGPVWLHLVEAENQVVQVSVVASSRVGADHALVPCLIHLASRELEFVDAEVLVDVEVF